MQTRDTILQINPNQVIPVDYLEALLKEGASIWGVAVVKDGKIIVNKSDNPTVQGIQDLHGIFKDKEMVIHVSNATAPVDPKSRQPFVLAITEEGKPAIVAFVEGDYAAHTVKDGIATDAYYMVKEILEPLVDQFYEVTNQSVEGTMKLMTNKMQEKVIAGACGERGTVVLMGNNGMIHTIQDTDQDATFEWGDVSRHNHFGQPESDIPLLPAKEEKKPEPMTDEEMMALAMGGNVEKAPITPAPAPTKPTDDKAKLTAEIVALHKKEDAKNGGISQVPSFVRLNISNMSNSAKKDLFDACKMPYPADWKNMKSIDVPTQQVPAKYLKSVAEKKAEPSKEVQGPATTATGSVPAVPATLMVPIIPPTQIIAFKNSFLSSAEVKAIMEAHGGKVPTEQELQAMEATYPSWSKQTDTPIENTAFYSYTADLLLCREYPNLAAALIGTYRRGYFKNFKVQTPVLVAAQDNQRAVGNGQSRKR